MKTCGSMKVSAEDMEAVRFQLDGQHPAILAVVKRCVYGFPSVVLLDPVPKKVDKKENNFKYTSIATPLWLTCPHLNDKIHKIESMGYIKRITDFLANDAEMMRLMKEAHTAYAFLRLMIFKEYFEDLLFIDRNNRVFSSGIGGIADVRHLKCLHLHYAHFAVEKGNVIGRFVAILVGDDDHCKGVRCSDAGGGKRDIADQEDSEGRIT